MKLASLVIVLVLCFLGNVSCGRESPESLYETAKFEEQQTNFSHAQQLYKEIIQHYPDSKYAELARSRLEEMKGK